MPRLETHDLTKRFGSLIAVDEVDFAVQSGRIQGLIGPNGAGKTTLISCITGRLSATSGTVEHNGDRIESLEQYEIARRGIATAEQLVSIYPSQTVLDNGITASHATCDVRLWDAVFRTEKLQSERSTVERRVVEILEEVGLEDQTHEVAENLAYGQKKRLMIAMGLATDPEFLILDEPVAGLNPEESSTIMNILDDIVAERDVGVVLIEHDMDIVMDRCDHITVLESGRKIAEGDPEQIKQDERVQEAYLG